jgi:secreted trypsin-like serine protease
MRMVLAILSIIMAFVGVASLGLAHADTAPSFSQDTPFKDFIVGGTIVAADDPIASTTVFISGRETFGYYYCTGSIIAQDILVTAAHCVLPAAEGSLRVIFAQNISFTLLTGRPDLPDSDPSVHQVYGAIAHPDYSSSGDDQHDIAIVRFKGDLPPNYRVAKLLHSDSQLTAGREVVLAGYGSTNAYVTDHAGELRKVSVDIDGTLGQTEISLDQSHGKGACWGDSGGPAFLQSGNELLLWGVTSRSTGARDCAEGSVYTKLSSYKDFIKESSKTLHQ